MIDLSFDVYGIPRPGGSKTAFRNPKTGKMLVMDSCKKNKEWRRAVAVYARNAYREEIIGEPIHLYIDFRMPRPKAHFRANGELKENAPHFHIIKPDLTKLIRSTEDALVQDAGILTDDCMIVSQTAFKRYCRTDEEPGATIRLTSAIET